MSPISRFFLSLQNVDLKTYIEKSIVYYGALISNNMRPARYITLPISRKDMLQYWQEYSTEVLQQLDLDIYIIQMSDKKMSAMLYRPSAMITLISDSNVTSWLHQFADYPLTGDVSDYLAHLKQRFIEQACPDELGIFLGYPMKDVLSYIEHEGKNFVCCQYWKVYHDVDECMCLFALYDKIQSMVAESLLEETI